MVTMGTAPIKVPHYYYYYVAPTQPLGQRARGGWSGSSCCLLIRRVNRVNTSALVPAEGDRAALHRCLHPHHHHHRRRQRPCCHHHYHHHLYSVCVIVVVIVIIIIVAIIIFVFVVIYRLSLFKKIKTNYHHICI